MYRESLFGVALAATLAELDSVCCLSEGQKEELWDIFDIAMERALAESPVTSQVRVFSPSPSIRERNNRMDGDGGGVAAAPAALSTKPTRMVFPANSLPQCSPTASLACCGVLDEGVTYPVYRVHDGMWTILLKDPTVEVRDGAGRSEKIHLDYLKVHLRDVSFEVGAKKKETRKKRRR
ncbi:hypothetical protein TcBrA4_0003620 [Trypanosoma cruzi]|nr:hypothetical protein TcBrA4_0003620 [Trypanosoma cruzi]